MRRLARIFDRIRDQRGSVLVEFGLVIPILTALIIGGVSFAMAYNSSNEMNNGAREAARYAATLPVEDDDMNAWLNAVADVAQGTSATDMGPTVPGQFICVAYVHPDGSSSGDQTTSLIEQSGGRTISLGTPCFDDGRPANERRVQVVLERDRNLEVVFWNRTITVTAESAARYERFTF